ncbi:MAG TPA: ADP-ribosylglycohydrolase family protein, partial [Phycisphaerales bacterium]|nr:ADP-ribosylglycohydrolase family protein [Phycisphaerales bacterium]
MCPRCECATWPPGESAYLEIGGATMRLIRALPVLVSLGLAASAFASPPRFLDRAAYTDRLQALWLAQVIANWTGLLTEGQRIAPPFFTDADWGTTPPGMTRQLVFITSQNPWGADDDTDIEYVYAQELFNADHALLTGAGLRQAWIDHINRFIWVSNAQARALMNRGMAPPATGLFLPNTAALHIDAQLTTEIFGAFAPGMPEAALRLADLPIRTTACGHAAHAAQFHVALYSLAALLDTSLPPREQAVWLVTSARAFVPDTSKTADVIDTVLADFLANPDASDWERTRDLIYQRYQLNAWPNGFLYRAWFESSVNLATGVLALLYGEMDLKRTIQIGTLSGWDSDNGTATMGGLIGLVQGTQAVRDAFQGVTLSDRFWIRRTRDNIHDYLPADAGAEDTFRLMSERHITIVDRIIAEQGGQVDLALQRFALPPVP